MQNLSNTVLNIVSAVVDKQKGRTSTELFLSESAIDSVCFDLKDNIFSALPLNKAMFVEIIVSLIKTYLESDECKERYNLDENLIVENLLNVYHNWTYENETIRIFLTNELIQEISFGDNYGLIVYVHENEIIKEKGLTGVWLYVNELLPQHQSYLENIKAFIQTKVEFDFL